ncbi:sigma-70 family RNA polymerase sigma factor [Rheinheimera faecalis]|uniref:sigma-70 family RNA polymerase sigma factor n=1 Tax=Rheinheimera faecalis TaxID=2901141 RepID=UPI001E4D2B17|nr:sigma-70 family RNA polymerase sigma factor [Rheinheimera faecalis]
MTDYKSTQELYYEKYQNWAYSIAHELYGKTSFVQAEYSDYIQYALLGLLEAVSSRDQEQEQSFMKYAGLRIRGTILNSIFKFSEKDWRINSVRKNKSDYVASTLEEVIASDVSGMSKLSAIVNELAYDFLLAESFEVEDSVFGSNNVCGDIYTDQEYELYLSKIIEKKNSLPVELQAVLNLYYLTEKSFSDIADILDVSKSQVFKLHQKALSMLKIEVF